MKPIATTLCIIIALFGLIHSNNQITDIIKAELSTFGLVYALIGQGILRLGIIGISVIAIMQIRRK